MALVAVALATPLGLHELAHIGESGAAAPGPRC